MEMDKKVRQIMKQKNAHHTMVVVERLHLPRSEGGKELHFVEHTWELGDVAEIR